MVQADPASILQCLLGLLSNAIKFSPKGSQVVVRVFKEGQLAHLTMRDQAKGSIHAIFLIFSNLDTPLATTQSILSVE